MTPLSRPSDPALAGYLRGECSRGEQLEIQEWVGASRANADYLEATRRLLTPSGQTRGWGTDQMWARLRHDTVQSESRHAPALVRTSARIPVRGARVRRFLTLAMAAGIVGAMGLTLTVRHTVRPDSPAPNKAPREYLTRRGERARIELADGTRVTLAPESRLLIPDAYGSGRREVSLTGEAIFDVAHDAAAPFQVRAGAAIVRDIGTSFDIRAYPADTRVVVAVAEGSVSLSALVTSTNQTALIAAKGSMAVLERNGTTHSRRVGNLSAYFGWATDHLTFRDEPLVSVLRTVARWYDLDIRLADTSLATRRVSADFSTKQPSDMVNALAAAVGAPVTWNGRLVTLGAFTPRGQK